MTPLHCPHCGEIIGEADAANADAARGDAGGIEVFSVSAGDAHGFAPVTTSPARTARRWPRLGLLAAAAIVLAGVAILGFGFWPAETSPIDRAEEMRADGEPAAPGSNPTLALTPRPLDAVNDAATAGVFRSLNRSDTTFAITYRSLDGLEVLQESGRQTVEPASVARFDEVLGFPLLVDGTRTWAVNAENPGEAYIAAHSNVLVSTDIEGSYVFVAADATGAVSAGVTAFGVSGPLFELPANAELLPVQGLGVLYRPTTGSTYRIAGLSPELFSEGRVLAATSSAWLEQRCTDGITCLLTVQYFDGSDSVVVDVDPNAEFSLSPDGRWLLRMPELGIPSLVDLQNGTTTDIDAFIREAAWAPDSSFFAWTEGNRLDLYAPPGTRIQQRLVSAPVSAALLVTATSSTDDSNPG